MRVPGHFHPAHAPPHPVRIDKKILDLRHVPGAEPGRKTDDLPAVVGDPHSAVGHALIGELEVLRMGEQIRPVAVVGQRCPAIHLAQVAHVSWGSIANGQRVHAPSLSETTTWGWVCCCYCDSRSTPTGAERSGARDIWDREEQECRTLTSILPSLASADCSATARKPAGH